MSRHVPGVVWYLRKLNKNPNGFVRTTPEGDIEMIHYLHPSTHEGVQYMRLPRGDARMLARRINQCLEGT